MDKVIIDVREPAEYAASHAAGAVNIPLANIPTEVPCRFPDKDTKMVLYCNSGGRSDMAIRLLQQLGYTKLTNGINQENLNNQ